MKVGVYAIAKNEAKHVDGWMNATQDADVRVVGDTGSTDGTVELFDQWRGPNFQLHHIHIEPFRFDLARNATLALVPPDVDVCISLDLDERLSAGWRADLERGWNQLPDVTKMGVMYHTPGLQPFWHNSRIHARKGYYWQDPCHEHLWPWMITEKEVYSRSVTIHHEPDRTKSRKSYIPLLAAGLNEEPGKIRRIFYYAREMMVNGEYEIALGWFKKYIELHEMFKIQEWWESEQARLMATVCEGAINEQRERREANRLP